MEDLNDLTSSYYVFRAINNLFYEDGLTNTPEAFQVVVVLYVALYSAYAERPVSGCRPRLLIPTVFIIKINQLA